MATEMWIGQQNARGGTYIPLPCKGLYGRHTSYEGAVKLYRFHGEFGEECHITDHVVLRQIDEYIDKEQGDEAYEYIYKIIINKLGIIGFISLINNKIERDKADSYKTGVREYKIKLNQLLKL